MYKNWTKVYLIIALVSTLLTIFIIVGDYDLEISNELRSWTDFDWLAKIVDQFLEPLVVLYCALLVVGLVGYFYSYTKLKQYKWLTICILVVINVGVILRLTLGKTITFNTNFYELSNDWYFITNYAYIWVINVSLIIMTILFFKLKRFINFYNTHFVAIVKSIAMVIFLLLVVFLLKEIFGRHRPYDVSHTWYMNWYDVDFSINRGESFPSGHTASACCFISFLFFLNKKDQHYLAKKIYVITVVSIFIFLIGLGRVIFGAHFLTDVLFSIYLAVFTYLIIAPKIYDLMVYFKNIDVSDYKKQVDNV